MELTRRRTIILLLFASQLAAIALGREGAVDDSDFAEFEDDEPVAKPAFQERATQPPKKHALEDEDDDSFVSVADDEEFEEFEKRPAEETEEKKPLDIKPLTFADIPSHFRSNWSSYQVEAVALALIVIYVINYLYGKTRNHSIAVGWFEKNRPLLEQQFSLVGDDGISQEAVGGHLVKDTDASYSVWSSGRAGCSGMLTQLKLVKRQDLMSVVLQLVKPKSDRVVHKIELDKQEMDSFVIAFGQRKSVTKAAKELTDLSTYAVERKGTEKYGLSPNCTVYAEIAETVPAIVDSTVIQFLKKYEKYIDSFHISDQFSGPRPQEESAARLPETTPTIIISYFLDENADDEVHNALTTFTFFLVERVRRYRLSKEGKTKADKKRQAVEEAFLKTTHQQRQEAAQARREEKTRERKQRLMDEEDPEKQRRLEKLEQKRDAKLKQPKMKQLKIK